MELTEKVRRKIVDEILSGEYSLGDKLPAEREMTELSGASRITVRRAYEQLEKAGIITRSKSAGTRVSDSFKGNDERIEQIAIIGTLLDPFAADFVAAVNRACRENDILNILSIADMKNWRDQAELAAGLASKGVRNIIVWGYDRRFDFSVFERLRILGVNLVFFDRLRPQGPYADFVGLDNGAATEALFEKALAASPKRLLYFTIDGLAIDSNDERLAKFQALCKKRGLTPEIERIEYLAKPSLKQVVLLEKLESSAVFCVNDRVALSLKDCLSETNRIYSVDGTPEAVEAGIASYSQPVAAMAAEAVECLRRQQKLGRKWRAGEFRFKGEILEK